MLHRITMLAMAGALILSLAACATPEIPNEDAAAVPEPPKAPKPEGPYFELTKETVTSHPEWTSRNLKVFGVKLGERTRDVEKSFGPPVDVSRNLPQDYLTIYQNSGLFVYTIKHTGKLRAFEINVNLAPKIADPKLKRLLTGGDEKSIRSLLGMEEKIEEKTEDPEAPSTEYVYDSRGIRFIKYKVKGQVVNAIRFSEPRL